MLTSTQHTRRFALVVLLLLAAAALCANAAPRAQRRDGAKPRAASQVRAGSSSRVGYALTRDDKLFIEDLSHRAFLYFLEHADARTGLVLDRARASGEAHPPGHPSHNIASSAATGFGLTALCIGAERGWVSRGEARNRVLTTLRFFAERAPQEHGWFLHWMDSETGERRWQSEYSSIDTALLLAGVLTARQYFSDDAEVVRLATLIYERVDFRWMLASGDSLMLSHGWRPETGFIKTRWDTYSEHLILQLLAIGSPTHAISPLAWRAWLRRRITYASYTYMSDGPLFTHQYTQGWADLRGRRESWYPFTDYFENSVAATRAHRQFCIDLATEFPAYGPEVWGVSASDSEHGYVAWGGPPRDSAIDGTVVPYAAAGSLMFTPDISLAALRTMKEKYGARVYGHYGFADAFNPNDGWVDPDCIGLDQGITLLSAENLRDRLIWRYFMRNIEITRALNLVGLLRKR
ncbi:MAG: hypothetical protein QOJ70_3210 [Acidobacteriota bacterium]|jgi:hypothetical protein|nr:hypothetical protein [Acidobacteriota bacterium]